MKRLLVVFAALALVFACKKGNDNPSEGKLTGITLSEHSIQVTVGGFHVLAVKFTPENASEGAITWVSSNPSVATVSDGIVSGIAPGKTEVFAKVGNLLDKCQVTVKDGSGGETSDDPSGETTEESGDVSEDASTDPSEGSEDPSGGIDWDSMGHEGEPIKVQYKGSSAQGTVGDYSYESYAHMITPALHVYSNGTFKAAWGNSSHTHFAMGLNYGYSGPGVDPATHNFVLDYKYERPIPYEASQAVGLLIGAHGWTCNPFGEFFIVDDWGGAQENCSAGKVGKYVLDINATGGYTMDGEEYLIFYKQEQGSWPGLGFEGDHYGLLYAVRKTKRSFGTMHISEHLKALKHEYEGVLGNVTYVSFYCLATSGNGTIDVTYFDMHE